MEHFFSFMNIIIEFMKRPMFLWGFETSFWNIFLYVILGTMVLWFIGSIFNG